MPGVQNTGSGKTYLSIVGGSFSQKVDEGTEGAKLRRYELKNGSTGEKWEITYTEWAGTVEKLSFEDTEYGKVLRIDLDDAVISINTGTRYFQDIAGKLMSADLSKEVTFHPYDFETPEGKRQTGVSVKQNGQKLSNFFYDAENKKYKDGYPQPEDRDNMDSDDWKAFFIKVKKYLIKELEALEIPKKQPINRDLGYSKKEEAGVDVSKMVQRDRVDEEEIEITDLPF